MKLAIKLMCFVAIFGFAVISNFDHRAAAIRGQAAGGQGGGKQSMPGKMVFDDLERKYTIYAGDKGKAPFDHAQHAKVPGDACVLCHHTNSETLTEKLEEPVSKCSACHKLDEGVSELEGARKGKTFKGKTAMKSEDAFHGGPRGEESSLIGCIGCHKKRDQQPIGCARCHNGEDK